MKRQQIGDITGFTLPEVIISVVILSIASLALIAPLLVSSSSVGNLGVGRRAQLAALCQEYAETVSGDLTSLDQVNWETRLSGLVAQSPITIRPDTALDGKMFRVTESIKCVQQDVTQTDSSCKLGFARVKIAVTSLSGGESFTLGLIKTRIGL